MKHIWIVIIVLVFLLPKLIYAKKNTVCEVESQIITEVVTRLNTSSSPKIFVAGFEDEVVLLLQQHFNVVDECQAADMALLGSNMMSWDQCRGVPHFVKDIMPYDIEDQKMLGSFYWKKGRPNISLFCGRAKKYGFSVKSLSQYCE